MISQYQELIQYINNARDFSYDDQEAELTKLLAKEGKKWRWSKPDRYGKQRVEVVDNLLESA